METLPPLPAGLARTRGELQRVATHVVARRRHDLTGRFGLRPSPGGVASPAAPHPDGVEVVRTDGVLVVVERGAALTVAPMTTLAALAGLVGVDLGAPFDAGGDAPPVGDPDAPLGIDAASARALGDWWCRAVSVIDQVVAWLGAGAGATVPQLWPEHFDVGCDVAWGPGDGQRANLGAAAGDAGHEEPYLYVGPWGAERPGDERYWNAPFGAVLGHAELRASADPRSTAVAFMRRGLQLLAAG